MGTDVECDCGYAGTLMGESNVWQCPDCGAKHVADSDVEGVGPIQAQAQGIETDNAE